MLLNRRQSRSTTRSANANAASIPFSGTTPAATAPSSPVLGDAEIAINNATSENAVNDQQELSPIVNGLSDDGSVTSGISPSANEINNNEDVSSSPTSESESETEEIDTNLINKPPPPPKHIPFPDMPQYSELFNEFVMFAYTTLAASMQFLHLYRSIFWLPDSNTKYVINFYLIDPYLAVFIYVLLSRRFIFCLMAKLVDLLAPKLCVKFSRNFTRIIFFFGIIYFLVLCCSMIFAKQGYIVIYLCYPLLIYFIAFGFRLEPFLRTTFESKQATYLNGSPLHGCSTNPETIRTEIESMRTDYNNRFKQVVCTAVLNAYYAGFIPCCFAQSYLYYDIYWATQHLALVLVGGFTMCTGICFPSNYCDVLHRAAMHLGQWKRIETGKYTIPAMHWSNMVIWPDGRVVKHGGEFYKSSGMATTAIPGNMVHSRFYMFFQNPSHIFCTITGVQFLVIIIQLIILYFTIEWHNIMSLGFLLIANYHTLFQMTRNYIVTYKIYAAELVAYDKISAGAPGN